MASLNAPGISVVSKQLVSFRSYGRNIAVTSGTNVHAQASVRLPVVQGVPAYARASGDFGTQSSDAKESTFHQLRFVKVAESIDDTLVNRTLGQIAPDSGNQLEIALKDITQRWNDHQGGRIVIQRSDTDTILSRERNDSVRPGG